MAKAYKKRVLGRGLSAILNDNDNNRFSENQVNSISKILIDDIKIHSDLVDMESYVYAKFSQKFNIDFACYKFVSDYADENRLKYWSKELLVGAELFKKKLLEICKNNNIN